MEEAAESEFIFLRKFVEELVLFKISFNSFFSFLPHFASFYRFRRYIISMHLSMRQNFVANPHPGPLCRWVRMVQQRVQSVTGWLLSQDKLKWCIYFLCSCQTDLPQSF